MFDDERFYSTATLIKILVLWNFLCFLLSSSIYNFFLCVFLFYVQFSLSSFVISIPLCIFRFENLGFEIFVISIFCDIKNLTAKI